MNRNKILHFLFSKAVILTYVFIGYLSLVDYGSPTCTVDSVPECSTNDLAYPSVQTFQVSMTEHIRTFKPATIHQTFGTVNEFGWDEKPPVRFALTLSEPPAIALLYYYSSHFSRAPPSLTL